MTFNITYCLFSLITFGIIGNVSFGAVSEKAMNSRSVSMTGLNLPKIIYAVPDVEINVYFDNVILVPNISNVIVDVSCEKGLQQNERWTYVASDGDEGDYPFMIHIRDADNKVVDTAHSVVRVSPKNTGKGQKITLLCIGDSLTHASVYTKHLLEITESPDEPNITLIGSHYPCDDADRINRHEGYGGWTAQRFVTHYTDFARQGDYKERGSPFLYKSSSGELALDFQKYCREFNASQSPNFVTIFLGCNDVFNSNDENITGNIDLMLSYYDTLIKMIHNSTRKTKIGLMLPVPPAATQDAFGANYKNGQTRWQYKRNQHTLAKRMIEKYENLESRNIFIVPTNLNLDCHNNYPGQLMKVNAQSERTILRQINGCHPNDSGYKQIGDSVYCWIKSGLL